MPRRGVERLRCGLVVGLVLLLGCTADPGADGTSPEAADESVTATPAPERRSPGPEPEPEVEPEPEPPPVPASRPALEASLDGVVAAAVAAAPDLELGVLVLDEFGREVVSYEADRPMLPASTAKQVTVAAALTTLGPEARLPTVVDATDGIDGAGRLDGDLIVIGSGDPTLVTDEYARFIYPARPRTPLSSLADQLVAAGLRHVTGDVRGTAPAFAAASLPTGWRDNYLSSLDGRYGAGLTVDGGLRTMISLPDLPDEEDDGEDDGEDGGVDAGSGAATDAEPGTDEDSDDADERPVSILEQLAALDTDLPPVVRVSLAEDPVLHTAAELTRLLVERGVVVDGVPTVAPPEAPVVSRLAVVASPPMDEILRFTVQRSDNHLADALALTVARARTGEGSWTAADRAFGQVLSRFEVPTDGVVFADGSGLSRDDRLTARALTELDRRLTGDLRFGGTWRSLQAVTGRSGTLQRRLVGTPAEGRLLAKTGTLRDVSSLSGQVIGRDADAAGPAAPGERRYHLTVIGNATQTAPGVVRAVVDEVTLALVADLDGCQVVPAGEDDGPLGRPPSAVRCAD